MRDKERIKRVLGLIEKIWSKWSDMRFYQLLINIGVYPDKIDGASMWNVEDDLTEKYLTEVYKKMFRRKKDG